MEKEKLKTTQLAKLGEEVTNHAKVANAYHNKYPVLDEMTYQREQWHFTLSDHENKS